MATTPEEFISSIEEPRRSEIERLDKLIRDTLPDLKRVVSGPMLGYGPFRYKYASGREGDTCHIGLSSRKQYISLYCCGADEKGYVAERYKDRLPKADIGKSCVRFKRVDDLDQEALKELLKETVAAGWGEAAS